MLNRKGRCWWIEGRRAVRSETESHPWNSPLTADGKEEHCKDDSDDDDDGHYNDSDDDDDVNDDDDEPNPLNEEHFPSVAAPLDGLMKNRTVSSLQLPVNYRQHPHQHQPYSLNTASLHSSELLSTPFSNSSVLQGSMPDSISYHDPANLNIFPTATGPPPSPPFVVRDMENVLNGCHSYARSDGHQPEATLAGNPLPPPVMLDSSTHFGLPPSPITIKDSKVNSIPSPDAGSIPRHPTRLDLAATQPLQRLSIDVECTPQQLSQIMAAVTGIASSVSFKVDKI